MIPPRQNIPRSTSCPPSGCTQNDHCDTRGVPRPALTDFGPQGRSTLFGNSADDYLQVHDQGRNFADVTEGSGWHLGTAVYDWSGSQPRSSWTTTRFKRLGRPLGIHPTPSHPRPTESELTSDESSWSARERTSRAGCSGTGLGIVGKRFLGKALRQRPPGPSRARSYSTSPAGLVWPASQA